MTDSTTFYADVGTLIRKARKLKNMTQEDLGKAVSLTRTSITNVERGRQKLPLHTFTAIARTLQVDVPALLPEQQCEHGGLDRILGERPASERQFIETVVRSASRKRSGS